MKSLKKQSVIKEMFSPRSQRSLLKQLELESEQQKFRGRIAFAEKRIAEGEARSHMQARSALGSFPITQSLTRTLDEIASREREILCYRDRVAALQAEIDALEHPTAEQARERAKNQSALAQLAKERKEKDAEADGALQILRKALQERAAQTAKMLEIAPLLSSAYRMQ